MSEERGRKAGKEREAAERGKEKREGGMKRETGSGSKREGKESVLLKFI